MLFQDNDSSRFSRHTLPKSVIELPNLDFDEFFGRKRLMHSKKYVNRCLFIESEGNH